MIQVGDVVEILSGYAFKSNLFNESGEGLPLVRIRDVGKKQSETYYSGEYSDLFLLNNGDFIIGMDGDFRLAKWEGGKALLNQRVCKITPNKEKIDPLYLYYILPKELKKIEDVTSFATVKHLSAKDIKAISIPQPSLAEQQKIAAILDAADSLRQKDQQLVELYIALSQSLFLEMFGEPMINPKKWPIETLGKLITEGPQNGLYKPSTDYGSGTPIVRIDSFHNDLVRTSLLKRVKVNSSELEKFKISEGDFVINRVNSPSHLGKCGLMPIINESMVFESNMMRVRFNDAFVNNSYMLFALSTEYMKRQILTASKDAVNQSSINQKDVNNFEIPLPPIQLQTKFAERIQLIEAQKQQAQRSLEKSEALFNSLLQRAFTGELTAKMAA